ncbi:MAG: hypothetical protein H0V70_20530 [Ktedonobacteraceae bacterium]|jgi:hypothetical protein|nr:hypothetical protein [Ktedonobacteraceae bacterium]
MSNENEGAIQPQEILSSDVVALCALFARIIVRCLREKDPHTLKLLSLSSTSEGEISDAA